jgi:3-dehydroquinate synthetase
MPSACPADIGDEQLREIMSRDKKAVGATPRFVLLDAIGRAHCGDDNAYAAAVSDAVIAEGLGANCADRK